MKVIAQQILPPDTSAEDNPKRPLVFYRQATHPTSYLEHLLLAAMIILTPLEDHLPSIGGRSVLYLVFGLMALYVVLMRPWALAATLRKPVFLAGYVWLGLAFLIESLQPHASYSEPIRLIQMILGGVFVASLCRDRPALRVAMAGYVLAALWLGVLLFLTTYGTLQESGAVDFQEASRVRGEVLHEQALEINLNRMAFYTAQGAVVALCLTLSTQALLWRLIFLGATTFCLVAAFLPLSRSGSVIALASCAAVTLCYGIAQRGNSFNRLLKTFLLIGALGGCVLALAPEAVFARLAFPATSPGGKTEARAAVYMAGLAHLPDYIVSGVGAGNFWGPWGKHSQFCWEDGSMHGAHNVFFQVAIYWGASVWALSVFYYIMLTAVSHGVVAQMR